MATCARRNFTGQDGHSASHCLEHVAVGVERLQIYEFLCLATEPLIQPFRVLLSRVDALRNSPFDFAFLLAFFVLIALERVLYMF